LESGYFTAVELERPGIARRIGGIVLSMCGKADIYEPSRYLYLISGIGQDLARTSLRSHRHFAPGKMVKLVRFHTRYQISKKKRLEPE